MGSVMSLPSMILFYVSWIISSAARPLLVATLVCMITEPEAAKAKLLLIFNTFQYMLLCKDKKWTKPKTDPASYFTDDEKEGKGGESVKRKTIIFLRHGESTWNDTFNKGDRKMTNFLLHFFPNLVKSFATEWYFLISGKCNESWFYDSPLSSKGISQAENVQKFIRESKPDFSPPKEGALLRLLKGEGSEKCQLVSSNLRRAISTLAIGLQDRLDMQNSAQDKIMILSELQEVSVNPDALSISPAKGDLMSSWMDSERTKSIYRHQTDTNLNQGNKPITSNGLQRMESFCKIVFEDVDAPNVLATGHSYWFRAFFQTYLPHSFDHPAKKKKIINGGIVAFTLLQKKMDGEERYMIDPKSLVVLYGGF